MADFIAFSTNWKASTDTSVRHQRARHCHVCACWDTMLYVHIIAVSKRKPFHHLMRKKYIWCPLYSETNQLVRIDSRRRTFPYVHIGSEKIVYLLRSDIFYYIVRNKGILCSSISLEPSAPVMDLFLALITSYSVLHPFFFGLSFASPLYHSLTH